MTERRDVSKDPLMRVYARNVRDKQWRLMERMVEHGTLWICPWNKRRLPERDDEHRSCLMSWINTASWFEQHADWFEIGKWSDERYAFPYRLTAAGHAALHERQKYDTEPVCGGLVGPGWKATPDERCQDA